MTEDPSLRRLLARVASKEQSVDAALAELRTLPFEDLGFAKVDHHRALRRGHPEVIYCAGKAPAQVAQIAASMARRSPRVLGTCAGPEHAEAVRREIPDARYEPTSRCLWIDREPDRPRKRGILLIAAGTSDLPVAEEAAITLDLFGHAPRRLYDVGVAGLQRLLAHLQVLQEANVVIVVAGMEGALPSVVAGLVAVPVIAVPTSVGYGASFGGIAALLGMLNSCSPGIGVVNIDNGFGAAYLAGTINQFAPADSENDPPHGAGVSPVSRGSTTPVSFP